MRFDSKASFSSDGTLNNFPPNDKTNKKEAMRERKIGGVYVEAF